jgi:hypothetical protein
MFELVVPTITILMKILEYKNQSYYKTFVDCIVPTFEKMLIIHTDYIQMFEETLKLLPNYALLQLNPSEYESELIKTKEYLVKRRREREGERIHLKTLTNELKREKFDSDVIEFVDALLNYFKVPNPLENTGSAAFFIVEQIEDVIQQEEKLIARWEELHRTILGLIEKYRIEWAKICEIYVRLTIKASK